jgi:hypothetical protein
MVNVHVDNKELITSKIKSIKYTIVDTVNKTYKYLDPDSEIYNQIRSGFINNSVSINIVIDGYAEMIAYSKIVRVCRSD